LVFNPSELRGDWRAGVAALGPVGVVAEAAHQLGPCPRDPCGVPACLGSRSALGTSTRNSAMFDSSSGLVMVCMGSSSLTGQSGQAPSGGQNQTGRPKNPAAGMIDFGA
jgi:hypothetical protein